MALMADLHRGTIRGGKRVRIGQAERTSAEFSAVLMSLLLIENGLSGLDIHTHNRFVIGTREKICKESK